MDKITVVCHKDHDKGYEDFQGKCLLCEVERLQNRDWVGLTDEEYDELMLSGDWGGSLIQATEAKLKQKNVPQP